MSKMELSLFRQRSLEALKRKVRRGELFLTVAIGYVKTSHDRIDKEDPIAASRRRLRSSSPSAPSCRRFGRSISGCPAVEAAAGDRVLLDLAHAAFVLALRPRPTGRAGARSKPPVPGEGMQSGIELDLAGLPVVGQHEQPSFALSHLGTSHLRGLTDMRSYLPLRFWTSRS